jgi:hypothetical protein
MCGIVPKPNVRLGDSQELVDKSFQMKKSSLDKFLALATRRGRSRGLPELACRCLGRLPVVRRFINS